MTVRSVAIACQGGGTHAAFSWGVLDEILRTKKQWDSDERPDRFDIAAITGTSAGALCALMVWYGFAPKENLPGSGSLDEAISTLDRFWESFAAREPVEVLHNKMSVLALEAKEKGLPLPAVNPYGVVDDIVLKQLSMLGAREEYTDFHAMLTTACPDFERVDWTRVSMRAMVGASEIVSGAETVFDTRKKQEDEGIAVPISAAAEHRWRQRRPFSLEGVIASGTLPTVKEAEEVGDGLYWDGLYSQNPPVRELVAGPPATEIPDEIWVLRINPQNIEREPKEPETIKDRENELMGNLSLNKELDFINVTNRWVEKYEGFAADKKRIAIRTIKMRRQTSWSLRVPSKFDRSANHMNELRDEGIEVARDWLARWPRDVGAYPEDAGY
jgi:NTE family protein